MVACTVGSNPVCMVACTVGLRRFRPAFSLAGAREALHSRFARRMALAQGRFEW